MEGNVETTNVTNEEQQVEQPVEQQAVPNAAPASFCANCGSPMTEGQMFCSKCGTAKAVEKKNVCGRCGAELKEGQEFCSQCGQKVDVAFDPNVNSAINQFNAGVDQTKNKKKTKNIIIIAAIAVVAIIVLSSLGGDKGVNFRDIYNDYCESTWAEVGSDGSYLYVDTNPYDNDDDGLAYPDAYTAIKAINSALGFPDSLTSDMGQTTGNDGKQEETYGDITVSWKYHPDKGLEVTYKKAN